MRMSRGGWIAMAVLAVLIGYPVAFAVGAGPVFVVFVTIGVAGELGLWTALIRSLR